MFKDLFYYYINIYKINQMLDHSLLNSKGIFKNELISEDMYNLLDKTFQIPENGYIFQVCEVPRDYIARPDLISLDAYGTTKYTDIICKLNGISNPFELNEGMQIILPSFKDISEAGFISIPSSKESENNKDELPKPKTKQEKRKPNEAIVGDSRFRIDRALGIIIY